MICAPLAPASPLDALGALAAAQRVRHLAFLDQAQYRRSAAPAGGGAQRRRARSSSSGWRFQRRRRRHGQHTHRHGCDPQGTCKQRLRLNLQYFQELRRAAVQWRPPAARSGGACSAVSTLQRAASPPAATPASEQTPANSLRSSPSASRCWASKLRPRRTSPRTMCQVRLVNCAGNCNHSLLQALGIAAGA